MSAQKSVPARDKSLQAVAQQMAKLDVSGLPRNYALFYDAVSGADAALTREVANLPHGVAQVLLDEIGLRYNLPAFVAMAVADRDRETRQVLELVGTIAQATMKKQNLVRALETTAASLHNQSVKGIAEIQSELEALKGDLAETLHSEAELTRSLELAADRLLMSSNVAEAGRTNSLHDRLTGLPNHAALAEKLDAFYDPAAEKKSAALFFVRLVDLADLANTYGQATAGRIVRRAASIFRKTIKKNDFLARSGPDVFAFVFEDVDPAGAKAIADRLITAISDNLVFASSEMGHSGHMRLAIGVAMAADAFSPQQIKLHATTALESLRTTGSGTIAIFGEAGRRAS